MTIASTTYGETSYDQVPYAGYAYWFTHPDHLALMGHLRGLSTARGPKARYLELGCGDGGNLLSLAAALPETTFVGIDLSATHIAAAHAMTETLGLRNVSFARADLRDFDPGPEPFDFIVAHGVYSWIPSDARDALLAVIGRSLAPHGVALVSYNTSPGQHDLEPVRRLMRFHTAPLKDPAAKIRQARSIGQTWLRHMRETEPETRGAIATRIGDILAQTSDQMMRHDWLSEEEAPILFKDFVAHAQRHGLGYLDNALAAAQRPENLDDEARELLVKLADPVRQQQYLDFFENTRFRVTLLAHAAALEQRVASFEPARFGELEIESRIQTDVWAPETRFHPSVIAETMGGVIEISGVPLRMALSTLFHHGPRAVRVKDLFEEVLEQLVAEGQDGSLGGTESGREQLFAMMMEQLVTLWQKDVVHFWIHAPEIPHTLPERPRTGILQREIAKLRREVPTLHHRHGELTAEEQRVLQVLDGSLDGAALTARFGPQTEHVLERLHKQGFIVGA
ncbi:MAG: class I SAM-dependent methyltransferase [Deltaproteobacteria bacterium]|nr:class I SAM-dependent methyltransferase [Deltaproteobacteria bacterium]